MYFRPDAQQHHKDMVLGLLLFHMSQDTRRILMREVPAAYNDVVGYEVVRVVHADDGRPVAP